MESLKSTMESLKLTSPNSVRYEKVYIKDHDNKEAELAELSTILEKIGRLVARAFWGTPTDRAEFHPWIWDEGNEENLEILKEQTAEDIIHTLRDMVCDGAIIYKAICGEEIVGAITTLRVSETLDVPEAPNATERVENKKPVRQTDTTNEQWLEMVGEWGINKVQDQKLIRAISQSLNHHFDEYNNLWELAQLCVDEDYRSQGIAKNLIEKALSEVESGHWVFLASEPYLMKYYERFGFKLTELKEYQYIEVTESDGLPLKLPVMTMRKP